MKRVRIFKGDVLHDRYPEVKDKRRTGNMVLVLRSQRRPRPRIVVPFPEYKEHVQLVPADSVGS